MFVFAVHQIAEVILDSIINWNYFISLHTGYVTYVAFWSMCSVLQPAFFTVAAFSAIYFECFGEEFQLWWWQKLFHGQCWQWEKGERESLLLYGTMQCLLWLYMLSRISLALTGAARVVKHHPAKRKVKRCSQWDTHLGCGPSPPLGACEWRLTNVALTHRCFSSSLSPSLPLCLKINK